jgi:hypothetical protein
MLRNFQRSCFLPRKIQAIRVFLQVFLRALRSSALQFAEDRGREDNNAED